MKKTPTKTAKTPAPAPKPTATAKAAKAPKESTAKVTAPKSVAPKKAPASRVAAAAAKALSKADPAPVVATIVSVPVKTVITAKFDVGFGNTLFIRGVGPGLSWEQGIPLSNAGEDLWTVTLSGASDPVAFKVLVNDENWSSGDDFLVESGATITVVPTF